MINHALRGAIAGLVGGLAFGAALARLDLLPAVARLVSATSATTGFGVNLAIGATLGAGFAVLVRRQPAAAGETVFWGLALGLGCWYLGALTALPLLSGESAGWSIPAARAAFPLLLGHLVYGATTAITLAGLERVTRGIDVGRWARTRAAVGAGARRALRGLLTGLAATWILSSTVAGAGQILASGNTFGASYAIGAVAGIGFCLLFPASGSATGPALVRGAGYGILLWVTIPLTVVPLLRADQLLWSATEVQARFNTLPAFVLLGALTAGISTGLAGLARLLLAAPAERADEEGVGARTLRAAGHGATAGVVGGLLFTVIMVQIGYLSTVAGLVGSDVTGVGLGVHLVVSVVLGASYGLIFRRQSYDAVSGIGWGVSYGFLWWVLGALTVLPIALGGTAQWTAATAVAAFPSLVGHLGYGAGLGTVFHLLEARHDPWWIQRASTGPRRASAIRRRTDLQSSAPAVWALVVPLALTVTVVLGG